MQSRWLPMVVLFGLLIGMLSQSGLSVAEAIPAMAPPGHDNPAIEVEPGLRVQLMGGQTAGYLIYFREKPDLSPAYTMDWIERGRFVADALRWTAERSQAEVRAYLEEHNVHYHAFWIENVIAVESSDRVIFNGLFVFPDIEALRQRRMYYIVDSPGVPAPLAPQAIEPNIAHVRADQAWNLGYTGEGIVVANTDTGVLYTHEALAPHYRGNLGGSFDHNYNWWDPYHDFLSAPGDLYGHGSHTMGIMVGNDGGVNQIGMAPGAKWISCRGCDFSNCTDTALLECAEFFVAPWDLSGAHANPDLRPHVVNHSWGNCAQSYNPFYQDAIEAFHATGIYPVFSNGNAGNCGYSSPPGLNTVGNPARHGNVTGVGSSGRDDGQYATHSNWGPTDDWDTVNPKPGGEDMKPQVLAPGVDIRSTSSSGDTYYSVSGGTSMAAPHVAGLVALLWQAAPCLVGDYAATETVIEDTATPIFYDDGNGPRSPNYATGWGEINALSAVSSVVGICGDSAIAGRVTDAVSFAALSDVRVTLTSSSPHLRTLSDDSGYYRLMAFSGVHTLQAMHYGYRTAVISAVAVTTGATTTQDIVMTPAMTYEMSGRVTDATTGWPLYAHIAIDGDPLDPLAPHDSLWSDPVTGAYSVTLAEGVTYTLEVAAWASGYGESIVQVAPLTQAVTVNIALQADMGACSAPGYRYVNGMRTDFEGLTFPPDGWTVTNDGVCAWLSEEPNHYKNATGGGGKFAISLGDYCRRGSRVDTRLISPPVDVSGFVTVALSFAYDYERYFGVLLDTASVDVSADNGATWVNIVTWAEDQAGPATFEQDVTSLLAGSAQARVSFHHFASSYSRLWQVDAVTLGNPVCQAPSSGGLVVGHVYDENYPTTVVAGVTVINSSGHKTPEATAPDFPGVDGAFYTLYAPAGAQVFTATARDYAPSVVTLTITDGAVAFRDFFLPAGLLSAVPVSVTATVEAVHTDTVTLTLENAGGTDVNFLLKERKEHFTPIHLQPYSGDRLQMDGAPNFVGPVPLAALAGDMPVPNAPEELAYPVPTTATAYGIAHFYDVYLVKFTGDAPGKLELIRPVTITAPFAGDFLGNDFSQMYVLDYDTNVFYTVDTATGGATRIGAAVPFGVWTGMSGGPDGTLYASSSDGGRSYLYEIAPATGALRLIGEISHASSIIDIAINAEGKMYGLDIDDDVLVSIDPKTGEGRVIGPVGFSANYAQGMDFEEESGALYLAAYDGRSSRGELRVVDLETGSSALVGAFSHNYEIDCLSFATGGSYDIPWLTESPVSGTVTAGGSRSVVLGFDAAQLDQPGDRSAELLALNDTPYGGFHIPVTMTVTAPDTWGKLEGTVVGLGGCDARPAPLAGATVQVESAATGRSWTLTTDTDGVFGLWLDQAHSPLTLTVSLRLLPQTATPDYFDVFSGVVVTAHQTTTMVIDLRLLKPCLIHNPADFTVALETGAAIVAPLTLSNTGAAVVAYEFIEMDGNAPSSPLLRIRQGDRDAPEANSPTAPLLRSGAMVYIADSTAKVFLRLNVDTPGALDVVSLMPHRILAGDFGPDGILYAIDWSTQDLISMDLATGALTTIGPVSPDWDYSNDSGSAMALDPTSGIMYAVNGSCSDNPLYTIDLATGAITSTGMIYERSCVTALAVDDTGQMYVYDSGEEVLARVDKFTGASAVVGPSGLDTRSAVGMDFDAVSGQMLLAVYNYTSSRGELYRIDSATGATTLIGVLGDPGNSYKPDWLALPSYGDFPWLIEAPASGVIAADTAIVADLTFDARTPAVQPGVYNGALKLYSDAINSPADIPLTLTVAPAADWGKVVGVVEGLGYCDSPAYTPLVNAKITIESGTRALSWTVSADATGAYQFWSDSGDSPLTVTVARPDYLSQVSTNVSVTAGETTTLDAVLRWARPCLSVAPGRFAVSLTLGTGVTLPFSLTNEGAGAATFRLQEIDAMTLNPATLISESFESGAMPPAGWETITIFGHSWMTDTYDPHSGNYYAYDISYPRTHSWLLSPEVLFTDGVLSFWSSGNSDVCLGENDFCDLNVWIVVGPDINDGDDILVGSANPDWTYRDWDRSVFTLTSLLPGGAVRIGFQYIANAPFDGVLLDDVVLDGLEAHPIPWLTETPALGVVTSDGVAGVAVTFDASAPAITQPGEYAGSLFVGSNDPSDHSIAVPVMLTVVAPSGLLTGAVSSLGRCDVNPVTLAGATVSVRDATGAAVIASTADAGGVYSDVLPAGAYTVTVDAPGHVSASSVVTVAAGAVVTRDFALTWLGPCVTGIEPPALNISVTQGFSATSPLTLTNTGAGAWNFAFSVLPSVPWLSTDPELGTVAPESSTSVSVICEAGVPEALQLGDYYATLKITGNATAVTVPVTMTVEAPATWGRLKVLVNGLDCGAAATPLPGAAVFIEGRLGMTRTATTDVSGTYNVWFDTLYSPVTVTISNGTGYEVQTFTDVVVTAGAVTILNTDLIGTMPCFTVHPLYLPLIMRDAP